MKARVKATGEIIEIIETDFVASNGMIYDEEDLIITKDEPDYWEKLTHQYAGMAMQGMFANPKLVDIETFTSIVCKANTIASELIDKLKEESKCEK